MARVIRVALFLAVLMGAGAFAWQQAQTTKLDGLIGEWEAKLEIKEPAELKSTYRGSVSFSWDPNKQHIRASGTLNMPAGKDGHATGFLTFDDSGAESGQCYRGAFAWGEDGRILTVKGKFVGRDLVLTTRNLASDETREHDLSVTTRISSDQITILVDVPGEPRSGQLLELTLTRKK